MALTPKEREVLELLARNLSNKEIGLAMQVGEETIKWHMKNLFAKLDAGTRRQVSLARASSACWPTPRPPERPDGLSHPPSAMGGSAKGALPHSRSIPKEKP